MPVQILVVEDEQIVALDIQRTLQNLGYAVPCTVADGEAAIERAGQLRPGLVLMDIHLRGEMDGVAAAGVIRARWDIPVVYLTAHADGATLARAKITEPFGYVLKPFDERELHTTVEMALYKHGMERKLRDSRRWLSVTLSSIGDGVIATDTDGNVAFVNPLAEQLTGWAAAAAVGRPLADVFHIVNEHTRQPVEDPVAKVLATGLVIGLANHTVLVARDGSQRPIDDSGAPIRDEGGETLGAVLVFRDVTERRQLERSLERHAEELAEAGRRKDQFLAMLGHELRNPLAGICGGVELLRHFGHAEGEAAQVVGIIERQANHMRRIIDDLLDVTRITHGKIALKKSRLDIVEIARQAAEDERRHIESRHGTLRLELPAGPLYCEVDPTRLAQVLANLLNNAAKFLDKGGEITLRVREVAENHSAAVAVRDTGLGIDAETLSEIFEPFVQARQRLERSEGGLGLGLALVRGLVQLHGGRITATSAGVGQGSEFTVELPLCAPPLQNSVSAAAAPVPEPGRRVLLVDDHQDALFALKRMLELDGHVVDTAGDGTRGMALARELVPEAIFCDIGLPGMNGYDFARQIRAAPGLEGVYLVAISGYGREEDRRLAREAGFDNYVTKPASRDVLAHLLASRSRFGAGPV